MMLNEWFYYLIDLHYSQTLFRSVFLIFSVLLPYRFTLFSNSVKISAFEIEVLLPYRFTLFSNVTIRMLHRLPVLLPYRFTLFSNIPNFKVWSKNVLLPYRFTLFSNKLCRLYCLYRFYYLIDLHYSQTEVVATYNEFSFTTL